MSWSSPKTWNVGDPGTSSDLNQYVRDNLSYLYGDTSWTTATLLTGFSAGSPAVAFRRIGTEVAFRGSMTTSTTAPQPCFNMPAGYFPAAQVSLGADSPSGTTIQITTGGAASAHGYTGSPTIVLDGLRYSLI